MLTKEMLNKNKLVVYSTCLFGGLLLYTIAVVVGDLLGQEIKRLG